MTREEQIVFLKEVLGWNFRMIGRAFDISHETARTIYKKHVKQFIDEYDQIMEHLKI